MKYVLLPDKTYREADLYEWSEQFEEMSKKGERHVGDDHVCGKHVSTVWLGLDHNLHGGAPHVFETMVFDTPRGGNDIYMDRYSTWEEAEEGHQKAIEWVKKHYG